MAITDVELNKIQKTVKDTVRQSVAETIVSVEFEERIGKIVRSNITDVLEEVVGPRLDKIEEDIEVVKSDVERVENKVDVLARKADRVADHQAEKLDQHDKEIGRLKLVIQA